MFDNFNTIEIAAIAMFFIGLYGAIITRNMIKSIIFTVLMESAVIMFFLGLGARGGLLPPIGENLAYYDNLADPLPQALMITAIIIGLSVTAINIVMVISLFRKHRSTDWATVRKASMENQ
ncbi:MAG: cation:proton antiporter subunit C [Defluviitaleaceae bacterium]|nr:cation:proton antiporter subunit C [Defluviitaleaceae bacterium]